MSVDYYLVVRNESDKKAFVTYIGTNLSQEFVDYDVVVYNEIKDIIERLDELVEMYPDIDEKPLTHFTAEDFSVLVDVYRKIIELQTNGPHTSLIVVLRIFGMINGLSDVIWWDAPEPVWDVVSEVELDNIVKKLKDDGYEVCVWSW